MSYCRWSSNNFMCDVYVYQDCYGGWTTHVAGNKLVFPPIPEPPLSMVVVRGAEFDKKMGKLVYQRSIDKLVANITVHLYCWLCYPHRWTLAIIPRRPIGLQCDGKTFNHETAVDCANNLEHLRGMGYKVPQYVIHMLRVEQQEQGEKNEHK